MTPTNEEKQLILEERLKNDRIPNNSARIMAAVYSGGLAIRARQGDIRAQQTIKPDGSTVGKLDIASGMAMVKYLNPFVERGLPISMQSEEKMPFMQPKDPRFWGKADDLDGSINPMVGGTNLNYIGVGIALHDRFDDQVAVAAHLPFGDPNTIFFAIRKEGAFAYNLSDGDRFTQSMLPKGKAQRNNSIESGWNTPSTNQAEKALIESGFYDELGKGKSDLERGGGTRDRVCGGIFQTLSGIRDNRQVVLNLAASHQADYLWLFLQEAGAHVIGQDGKEMSSTSYAMLSVAPSYNRDRDKLEHMFVEAMRSPAVGGNYQGWSPGEVILEPLAPRPKKL